MTQLSQIYFAFSKSVKNNFEGIFGLDERKAGKPCHPALHLCKYVMLDSIFPLTLVGLESFFELGF